MLASIRNTEIYFDIAGMQLVPGKHGTWVERPVLFLLHGGPGSNHLRFKQHSLALQEVAQLVFIDSRGCGRSKKTKAAEYTLENNVEDIEALRKHLGLKKICLLGASYGGIVAQAYAIRYSKNLEKLILSATVPSYRHEAEAKAVLMKRATPQQIAICEHLWNGTFKNLQHVKKFFTLMEPLYSVTARLKRKRIFSNINFSYQALNKGASDLAGFDFIADLHKIRCPTLILAGQEDWICSPNQAKVLAQAIKNAQLKIFKHCAHAIANDAPHQYIKTIKNFLLKKHNQGK